MASFKEKRKKVEELVYSSLSKLDPSGMNAEKYKKVFAKMNDKEFLDYFKRMKGNDDFNFYVEVDLYSKNNITMDSITETSKHLNVPLEEYVYIRHKSNGIPIRSAYKVPVLHIHLKRMQQLLSKKTRTNVDILSGNVRSRITGSLDSKNRSGRFTDADTQALLSITSETGRKDPRTGLDESYIVKELLGMRGDNLEDKLKMQQLISLQGGVNADALKAMTWSGDSNDPDALLTNTITPNVGQATKALDIFLRGAGMKSDVNMFAYKETLEDFDDGKNRKDVFHAPKK